MDLSLCIQCMQSSGRAAVCWYQMRLFQIKGQNIMFGFQAKNQFWPLTFSIGLKVAVQICIVRCQVCGFDSWGSIRQVISSVSPFETLYVK